jgi:hypothetical protein
MKVIDKEQGRLGNAIFRYFASTLFCIIYGAERCYTHSNPRIVIMTDSMFIEWSELLIKTGVIPDIPVSWKTSTIMFTGYFQHDRIYVMFRKELMKWMHEHPYDILSARGAYEDVNCTIGSLIFSPTLYPVPIHNIVVHFRLEDFMDNAAVIDPRVVDNCISGLLDKDNSTDTICIVVKKPYTDIEKRYIEYFKKKYNVCVQSNDVIFDFHIMCAANTLVCSCSTLSWCAAFLSNSVNTVYMPDYDDSRSEHETFKYPIANTNLYPHVECSMEQLSLII